MIEGKFVSDSSCNFLDQSDHFLSTPVPSENEGVYAVCFAELDYGMKTKVSLSPPGVVSIVVVIMTHFFLSSFKCPMISSCLFSELRPLNVGLEITILKGSS